MDDEPATVQLLAELLGHAGFLNLKTTTDSREVVALFAEFEPDIILLDLSMPHFDGFEIMEQLSALIPEQDYVPIIVLTAVATAQAMRSALSAGANDFLTKPFESSTG